MRPFYLMLIFPTCLFSQTTIVNLGFEGASPLAGWYTGSVPADAGFRMTAVTQNCVQGQQCISLSSPPSPPASSYGVMTYNTSATPYVGRVVRYRAAIRAAASSTLIYSWLNVTNGSTGLAFGTSGNVTSTRWQYYQFDVAVPPGSTSISFGFVIEAGSGWVDDASLTVLAASPLEAPRPLSNTVLANLTAFARMLGCVRHFHPSDQSAGIDWNQFAVQGVRAVEGAATPSDLAGALQAVFAPVAPTVHLFTGGSPPALPAELQPASTAGLQFLRWYNYGVQLGPASNIYTSTRQNAPANGPLPDGFQDPAQPYIEDLGQGLSAMIPLTLYADAQGTQPHGGYTQPGPEGLVVGDRATRLAGVILAWSVVQNFYPYFDVVQTDWPEALSAALTSAATNAGASDYLITLERLVAAQRDGHGYVFQTSSTSTTYMVPLIWDWVENQLIVTYIKDGQQQGVTPGDRVLEIDGTPVENAIAAGKQLISGATPQWILYRTLNALAKCQGQTMELKLEPNASPGTTETVRFNCGTDTNWTEPRGAVVQQLQPGIMYVDLNRATDSDWNAALPALAKATGIVLDMRGYPTTAAPLQYLSQTPLSSEQWHIPIPTKPDRTDLPFTSEHWTLPPLQPYLNARRVWLTDGRAVSFAETNTGIVEHYKLAEIVGGPTAGTNGNINSNVLPGGFQVSFTGMKVLKQDGSQYMGVGVHPTVPAWRTRSGVAAGLDEVLQRGIQVVQWSAPGPTPAITAQGIVNAASFAGGAVAPGEMVTLFGSDLSAAATAQGSYDVSGYLPLSVGDVKVFFDGVQAPLTYASATQVNAIVPYEVAGGATQVHVEVQGRSSNQVTVPVAAAAPGVFAGIWNQDGSLNSESNPAARGDVVTLYATGEGQTSPAGKDGLLPTAGKWPAPAGSVVVAFDGMPGTVLFQGETYAGVLQVNVTLPATVQPGTKVPVTLSVGGISSASSRTLAAK
jgi:uncharacterized protein (TIGR03437 family)